MTMRLTALRREIQRQNPGVLTTHPVCDCGKEIPIKHWAVHRGSCAVVQAKRNEDPPKPAA